MKIKTIIPFQKIHESIRFDKRTDRIVHIGYTPLKRNYKNKQKNIKGKKPKHIKILLKEDTHVLTL